MNDLMIEIKEVSHDLIPEKLMLEADPSIERVSLYLKDSFCYAAFLENEIVGVCILKPMDKSKIELFNIGVLPEKQKSGIGSELLRFVLASVKKKGFETVELGTGTFGYQLAFYQRFGFRVDSVCKDHFINNYIEPIFENGIQLKDMLRLILKF